MFIIKVKPSIVKRIAIYVIPSKKSSSVGLLKNINVMRMLERSSNQDEVLNHHPRLSSHRAIFSLLAENGKSKDKAAILIRHLRSRLVKEKQPRCSWQYCCKDPQLRGLSFALCKYNLNGRVSGRRPYVKEVSILHQQLLTYIM